MRPKWHFSLTSTLSACAAVCVFLAALYLASLVIFEVRESGIGFAPRFGSRGWVEFLLSFPWLFVIGSLLFLALLEELLRRYSFVYRRPLLYSASALVIFLALASVVADLDNLHPQLRDFSKNHGLPIYDAFKQAPFGQPSHFFHGAVIRTASGTITVVREGGALVHVDIEDGLEGPNEHATNSPVVIFGEYVNGQWHAYGLSPEPAEAR